MDPFLKIKSLEDLLQFPGSNASGALVNSCGELTQDGVTNILELCEAVWIHSGDASAPHVELTSGLCSNGFVDTLRALRYTSVSDILAYHLVHKIEEMQDEMDLEDDLIDWVVGSDHAGATFSHDVARWLGAQHDFTEKGPDKTQVWKRFEIKPSERVLQVEELMTTTKTLMAVRDGLKKGNPYPISFAPVIGCLVHRSDVYDIDKAPIVYLVHYDIKTWKSEECPLCPAGSKRIKEPKKHWAELTGR